MQYSDDPAVVDHKDLKVPSEVGSQTSYSDVNGSFDDIAVMSPMPLELDAQIETLTNTSNVRNSINSDMQEKAQAILDQHASDKQQRGQDKSPEQKVVTFS